MSAIAILIAVKSDDGKPVGSCTLHEHWRDKDAAYVGVLGVRPEALGKKVGKKLLLRSIQIVRNEGYKRVDLNTWAGNTRAVPLYKKVGLMWNPEASGVQMEDYIPAILEHPFSKPFFRGMEENEWYDYQKRELTQKPDEMTYKGMDVYAYDFERDQDDLTVIVDRHARAISSIDRTVNGQCITISARVDSHKVLCGVTGQYILEVVNDSDESLSFKVNLASFPALEFKDEDSIEFQVDSGDTYEWAVPFAVSSSAPIHRENIRSPTIDSNIHMNGVEMHFQTGMVIKPIADIKSRWPYSRVLPGGASTLPLIVLSSIEDECSGILNLDANHSSFKIEPRETRIDISQERISGVNALVSADYETEPGEYSIIAKIKTDEKTGENGKAIETRDFKIPLFCGESGIVSTFEDKRNKDVIINGVNYQATMSVEGARLRVRDIHNRAGSLFQVRSQVGPPFGMDPFRYAERDFSTEKSDDGITVSMVGSHPERPLKIEDRVFFQHENGVISHEVLITNEGENRQKLQLRVYCGSQGIDLSPGTVTVPLKDGIVKQGLIHDLFTHPSVPSSPDAFSEGWIASNKRGLTKGQLFDLEAIDEIHMGNDQTAYLQYPLRTLEPGETARISKIWFVTKASDWQDVRRTWKEKILRKSSIEFGQQESLEMHSIVDISVNPCTIDEPCDCEIHAQIHKRIVAPLTVEASVQAPNGWSAEVIPPSEDEHAEQIEIKDVTSLRIKLTPRETFPDGFHLYEGTIVIQAATTYKKDFRIIQLGGSDTRVSVDQLKDSGLSSYEVYNGLIRFRVSPEYGGCVYSLKNPKGTELLVSTFPEGGPKPGAILANYYGGIQPITWDDELNENLSSAETNKEDMSASICEKELWRGVEISWTGNIQDSVKGVSFRVQYYTFPNSPLLAARWIVKNTTSAPVKISPTFVVDPAFDGDVSNIMTHMNWEGEEQNVKLARYPLAIMPSSNCIWIEDEDLSEEEPLGLGLTASFEDAELLYIGVGDLILTGTSSLNRQLLPGKELVTTSWFMVNPQSLQELDLLRKVADDLI
ncbi:MAG: GNAT family N-acetyltransferase [Promethearchaeati archaeon]